MSFEAEDQIDYASVSTAPKARPRIAMMGEFSAGKSTLSNIMIGRRAIPMKVTATHLPPVWMTYGTGAPCREDLSGRFHPVDWDRLEEVPLEDTAFIHLQLEAEVLEVCDLIDTPGISDPNMAPEVWQRAAAEADGVIWLTHATQAWRQSEAAVWDQMPEELWARSLLLVTRFDKLTNETDRQRVLARVRKETSGLFRLVLPISLTEALSAGDDAEQWETSGGQAFSDALLELVTEIERRLKLDGTERPLRTVPDPSDWVRPGEDDAADEDEPDANVDAETEEPRPRAHLRAVPTRQPELDNVDEDGVPVFGGAEDAAEEPLERHLRVVTDEAPAAPGPVPRRVKRDREAGSARPRPPRG